MREIRTSGLTRGRATALPTLPVSSSPLKTEGLSPSWLDRDGGKTATHTCQGSFALPGTPGLR